MSLLHLNTMEYHPLDDTTPFSDKNMHTSEEMFNRVWTVSCDRPLMLTTNLVFVDRNVSREPDIRPLRHRKDPLGKKHLKITVSFPYL